ncbi:MAG: hypothetical protein CM15mV73_500 [Caudoviricetes sp.]|nr:MAG: hypothetical protein CM15mV73_500 [Caudoviricetes sp.]
MITSRLEKTFEQVLLMLVGAIEGTRGSLEKRPDQLLMILHLVFVETE